MDQRPRFATRSSAASRPNTMQRTATYSRRWITCGATRTRKVKEADRRRSAWSPGSAQEARWRCLPNARRFGREGAARTNEEEADGQEEVRKKRMPFGA